MRPSEYLAAATPPGPRCAAGLICVFVGHSWAALSRANEQSIPRLVRLILVAALLPLLFTLTACGGAGFEQPTATPLPTSSLPGLDTVEPRLCQVAKLPMLRAEKPQGDMLAWAPEENTLAYLAPTTGSTWLVGTLMTISAPDFAAPAELADYVAGHLTWSPQGSALAFINLRRSDGLYSVAVVTPQTGEVSDLFSGEAARTDEWSSQKAVRVWLNEQTLQVEVSCGLDCVQGMLATLPSGTLSPFGDPIQRPWDWWAYRLNSGPELPENYLEFVEQVNWAPDGTRLAYVDARRDAWVLLVDEGVQFPLPTGGFLAVTETDWSADGAYLAVQAEDWLFIFGEDCP